MRHGQQNRRGRGRSNNNNNNRKGQNPLTRNFESNGPDVKIKGTPAHVAEKYMSYARDALSSGDPVLAENFLQHAEHYNRIILSYREQQIQNAPDNSGGPSNGRQRNTQSEQPGMNDGDAASLNVDDSGDSLASNHGQQGAPQPDIDQGDAQPPRNSRNPRSNRNDNDRQPRSRNSNGSGTRSRGPRQNRQNTDGASSGNENKNESSRERNRFGDSDEQPQFLRRPVRRSRSADQEQADGSGASPKVSADAAPSRDEQD